MFVYNLLLQLSDAWSGILSVIVQIGILAAAINSIIACIRNIARIRKPRAICYKQVC